MSYSFDFDAPPPDFPPPPGADSPFEFTALPTDIPEPSADPNPWDWVTISPQRTLELWQELYEFTSWLNDRYLQHLSGTTYPFRACWFRHPVAVEHLTALMIGHRYAYSPDDVAPSPRPMEWHDRALFPMLERFRVTQLFQNCSKEHTDAERNYVVQMDREGFNEHLERIRGGEIIA